MAALSAACPLGATHALRGTAVAVRAPPAAASCATRGAPLRVRAGNEYENGVFTPLVIVVRNVMGVKPFNQFRGKAISLHSQVITEFCKSIGADVKVRQGLIRLAKKNGGKLGFLS